MFFERFTISKRFLRELDFPILITILVICIFGSLNIYSASHLSYGNQYLKSQIIWIIMGFILVYFILLIDYSLIKSYAAVIYWLGVFLLVINCIPAFQYTVNGASSWIKIGKFTMQPSEFAKVGIILMLAKELDDMEGNINNLKNFLKLTIYAAIPMALIVSQPDMGMTMVCFFTVLGIFFISGLDLRVILGGMLGLILVIAIAWKTTLIPYYQRMRIISLFNADKYQLSKDIIKLCTSAYTVKDRNWIRRNIWERFLKWNSNIWRICSRISYRLYLFCSWRGVGAYRGTFINSILWSCNIPFHKYS